MTITLLAITDGRGECLARTLASASVALDGIGRRVLVNDCPDPKYQMWLERAYGRRFEIVGHESDRRGFAGAIQAGWDAIGPGDGFVFHLEDDFVFNRPAPLQRMAALLNRYLNVTQVALTRQAWNAAERAAGGLLAAHPGAFTERHDEGIGDWLEHHLWWTTNPSLYRRSIIGRGWPSGAESEGRFTAGLRDAGFSFGYWGRLSDSPWVTHIGQERAGVGY